MADPGTDEATDTGGEVASEVGALVPGDPRRVDRYRLLGRIGEGGHGVVYLAQAADGTQVALKLLRPGVLADGELRQRMAVQAELARFLPSAAVVRVLVNRVNGDPAYLVSEYVPGPSLAGRVHRGGPLTGAELDRLLVGSLEALAAVHRGGVVHNDIKPANLVLGADGPRIADFDIAQRAGAHDPDAPTDGVLGSAAFLAPERLDPGPADPAADVFAWAATAVFAAGGRAPFGGADVADVIRAVEHDPPDLRGVPARLRPLMTACLEKDPGRRPTAEQALSELLALGDSPAAPAPPRRRATQHPVPPSTPMPSRAVDAPTGDAWGSAASAAPPWGTSDAGPGASVNKPAAGDGVDPATFFFVLGLAGLLITILVFLSGR